MKKLLLLGALILSVNAMAETFVGGGYDFYKQTTRKIEDVKRLENQAKLRLEFLPYEETNLKGGIGIAHSFEQKIKLEGEKYTLGSSTPVYFVLKPEWKINDDLKVYNKYRLGWSFNMNKSNKSSGEYAVNSNFKSGPYASVEVGTEYKKVVLGVNYDANFIPSNHIGKQHKGAVNHQVGLTIGYVFNGEKKSKPVKPYIPEPKPVIMERPVEKVVQPPKKVEKVKVKKNQTGKAIVKFQFDDVVVKNEKEKEVLNKTNEVLNQFEYVDVAITGHTDSKGSDLYNQKLSEKRAKHVAEIVKENTDPKKVNITNVEGKGETMPIADNKTEEGRAANRRVEIDFKGWFEVEEIR